MTSNDELERWRLTKNGYLSIEWEGRPQRETLPLLAQDACFIERDYDTAKNGPVKWYCSGEWRFEEITHSKQEQSDGETDILSQK